MKSEDARLLQEFLDRDTTCQLCGVKDTGDDASRAVVALETCDHRVCSRCTYAGINTTRAKSQRDYMCPVPGCWRPMAQGEVKRLLSPEDFETFVDLGLADLQVEEGQPEHGGGALVKCPKGCGWAVLIDAQSPAGTLAAKPQPQWESLVGLDGQPVSEEAMRHRQVYVAVACWGAAVDTLSLHTPLCT